MDIQSTGLGRPAWEGLVDRARVRTGQKVLVHAGAGGVGHVAIHGKLPTQLPTHECTFGA